MTEPRRIAVVSDYDGLIAALKERAAELELTNQTLDEITGLHSGYVGKLFGPRQGRSLGGVSFGLMLQALGLAIVVVEDEKALATVSGRHDKRKRVAPMHAAARTLIKIPVASTRQARRMARKRWANTTPKQRRAAGRKAAKSRWRMVREKRREERRKARALMAVQSSSPPAVLPPCADTSSTS